MERKPLILVPYRDRFVHLKCFTSYMKDMYPNLQIAIIEQDDDKPWNKGMLFNAGYLHLADAYSYIILHDIDMLPVPNTYYGLGEVPILLATHCSQFNYSMPYPEFFGGVVILSKEHYELVNGFSNKFKGYGGEDDLFYRSFIGRGIFPGTRMGRFECFEHPRPKVAEYYNSNLTVLAAGRDYSEGLSTVKYTITDQQYGDYIHIKVKKHE